MKKTYFLFTVQAYELKLQNGNLVDSCSIKVIAKTEAVALTRAEKLVKKTNYRVHEVVEYIEK